MLRYFLALLAIIIQVPLTYWLWLTVALFGYSPETTPDMQLYAILVYADIIASTIGIILLLVSIVQKKIRLSYRLLAFSWLLAFVLSIIWLIVYA